MSARRAAALTYESIRENILATLAIIGVVVTITGFVYTDHNAIANQALSIQSNTGRIDAATMALANRLDVQNTTLIDMRAQILQIRDSQQALVFSFCARERLPEVRAFLRCPESIHP